MNIPLKVSLGYLNAKNLNIPLLQIVHPFNWWAYVHFNSQTNGWLSPFLVRHFPTWKYIRPAWCTFWLMKRASRFGQGWLYSVREKLCPSSIWNEQEFIPWQTLQVEECLNSSPEIHLKTSMEVIEIHLKTSASKIHRNSAKLIHRPKSIVFFYQAMEQHLLQTLQPEVFLLPGSI